jgi:signal transduction histidine kinase
MDKYAIRLFALLCSSLLIEATSPALAAQTHTVLALYSDDRRLPANIEGDQGLRTAIAAAQAVHVDVFDEDLDQAHFALGSPAYERTVAAYLHDKYASRVPDIIVVGGNEALDFVLRNRSQLFPAAPVVHMGVDRSFIQLIPSLPEDVIGDSVEYDVPPTIEIALRLHPLTRRLVVVTGASVADRRLETKLRHDFAQFDRRISIEFLTGLPTAILLDKLRALGPDTIVFTPGYSEDGNGRIMAPIQSARLMAAAASVPIYVPYSTFIGTGVVGGYMATYDSMGREAGGLVNALLAGASPASIKVAKFTPTDLHIDWRQVQRWGIDEGKIPKDAQAHFRAPSLWEAYRNQSIAAGVALLLLTVLSIRLLTERRSLARTTEALKASEQRMTIAARAAKLAMWVWNRVNNRISIEPSQPPFEPANEASITIADALAIVHPADRPEIAGVIQRALAENQELSLEYRTITAAGEVRWVAVLGRPHFTNHDQWVGIVLDITDRKQAQLQSAQDRHALQHMTRVSMLGQMSASIAHQLNQPLTAILANAEAAQQMLRVERIDLAEVRQICDDIVAQVQRAAAVIRRLGALFKRGEVQVQQIDMNALLSEVLDLLHASLMAQRVTVTTELATPLHALDGDKVQLQQVLLNLIMNAIEAMRDTPNVMRRLLLRTEMTETEIRISVTDNGTGIAPTNLENIFEPFWSAKPSGMGIGLSICHSIVAAHHGVLTASNNPDGGATFLIVFPIGAAA